MDLGEIIKRLEKIDGTTPVRHGFGEPNSYRGYYEDIAFEPVENTTIGDMLKHAKSAMGKTFTGYKGGEYKMCEFTECWISEYGTTIGATCIGETLFKLWEG